MESRLLLLAGMGLLACGEPSLPPRTPPVAAPAPSANPEPHRAATMPPGFDASMPQLPRLSGQVVVDGKTDDFGGAASVPLRTRALRIQVAPGHEWRGLSDLSAEAYAGWNSRGIAMAVVVRDDDVGNGRGDQELYQEDCVELFIDGRTGAQLRSQDYGAGAYQLFVPAPTQGRPAHALLARDAKIEGLEIAALRRSDGYTVEVLFPWSAFPGLAGGPRSRVGLAFQVDEHDARDGDQGRSTTLVTPTSPDLYLSPALFEPWQLVDQFVPGGALGSQLAADVQGVFGTEPPKQMTVEVSAALGDRVDRVRVRAPFLDAAAQVANGSARIELPSVAWPLGRTQLDIQAVDARGERVGQGSASVVNLGKTIPESLEALRGADLLKLPFRGAAWLGAASALQRLREAFAAQDASTADRRAREVRARLALLGGRAPEVDRASSHDLLVLGADAEVVIEYPGPTLATVTFLWGSIPLGSVLVTPNPDGKLPDWNGPMERVTIAGKRGLVNQVWVHHERMAAAAIDPAKDVFVWRPGAGELWVVAPGDLGMLDTDGRVDLGPGPRITTSLPPVSLGDAARHRAVLIVGDPRNAPALARARRWRAWPRLGATRMALAADGRLLEAIAPSREAAELMLGYVLANQPITLSQLDALRRLVVRAIAPDVVPAPATFWCGDLHMHSFYSDGAPSPTALLLAAMYSEQDFSVLTDHNTLMGIERLRGLLARHGFGHPALPGEEYTTEFHSVIFPLTVPIAAAPKADSRRLARVAHGLGAFLQWNHPHYTSWGGEYWSAGPEAAGFDAWEHLPPRIDVWTRQGKLPLITGSTDTHDGTFGNLPERTIVFADSADGAALATALRQKRAVAVLPEGGKLFYGPAAWVKRAQAALAEGNALRATRADRLRKSLAAAKLADLVAASETEAVAKP